MPTVAIRSPVERFHRLLKIGQLPTARWRAVVRARFIGGQRFDAAAGYEVAPERHADE
jgi:hypothetical protein